MLNKKKVLQNTGDAAMKLLSAPFSSLHTYNKEKQQDEFIRFILKDFNIPEGKEHTGLSYEFRVKAGERYFYYTSKGVLCIRRATTDADLVFYYDSTIIGHIELQHFADGCYRDAMRTQRMFDSLEMNNLDVNPCVLVTHGILQMGSLFAKHALSGYWIERNVFSLYTLHRVEDTTARDIKMIRRYLSMFIHRALDTALDKEEYLNRNKFTELIERAAEVNEEYPIESPLYSIPSLIRSLRSSQACSISYLH